MLTLFSALILLGSDPSAVAAERLHAITSFRVNCPSCFDMKRALAASDIRPWGGTFEFQEGPTTPKVVVYGGPLLNVPGRMVLTAPTPKKR